jgi:hypothetical protein
MSKINACGSDRSLARLAAAAALLSTVACTTVMPPPMATSANVQKLRAAQLAPAAVGSFQLAPGRPREMDAELSGGLRGGNIEAPGGSYSRYLRDILAAELNSAGLLDLKAATVIEGQLTQSAVDAAIGTGTARLAARFQVLRAGQLVFDKEIAVDDAWSSSFIGAVAIPLAIERYTALYRSLVGKLVDDADFRRALAR